MLAALTAPAQKSIPAWSNDGLAEDVAVLSYEHALRAHARYRPADTIAAALQPSATEPEQAASLDAACADAFEEIPPAVGQMSLLADADAVPADDPRRQTYALPARNLKCTSVTIRLSEEECAQLRTRAAESGLTVSAYLRSCTFEAESLRAQVKEALAELRSGAARRKAALAAPWLSWRQIIARFRPRPSAARDIARA
jgi:hypothetical protein